jgi:hypothetical protein
MAEHTWHHSNVENWTDHCEDVLTLPHKENPPRFRPRPLKKCRPSREKPDRDRAPKASPRYMLRIADVKQFLDAMKKQVQWVVVVGKIPALRAIASDLFIGTIEIEFDTDPEIPHYHYVVFNVTLSDNAPDLSSLRREWYRKTQNVLKENCDKVRLSLSIES